MSREAILIIDNDPELARIIGLYLNLQGFRVNHTSKARDAITKLNLQKYAAVLLDPDLGDHDRGEEILQATQDTGMLNSSTPFVLVSRSLDYELPNNCLQKIKSVVAKPFEFDDLMQALIVALRQGGASSSSAQAS